MSPTETKMNININYKINHDLLTSITTKLNPQQDQLLKSFMDLNEISTKEEIIAAISPVLKTKQNPFLIFQYYQAFFVKEGILEIVKSSKPKYLVSGVQLELELNDERIETKEELAEQGW